MHFIDCRRKNNKITNKLATKDREEIHKKKIGRENKLS